MAIIQDHNCGGEVSKSGAQHVDSIRNCLHLGVSQVAIVDGHGLQNYTCVETRTLNLMEECLSDDGTICVRDKSGPACRILKWDVCQGSGCSDTGVGDTDDAAPKVPSDVKTQCVPGM